MPAPTRALAGEDKQVWDHESLRQGPEVFPEPRPHRHRHGPAPPDLDVEALAGHGAAVTPLKSQDRRLRAAGWGRRRLRAGGYVWASRYRVAAPDLANAAADEPGGSSVVLDGTAMMMSLIGI